jgi:hypothetical protein
MKNGEVFHRIQERNILHKVKRRKANWIGHTLGGNCLLEHVITGKTDIVIYSVNNTTYVGKQYHKFGDMFRFHGTIIRSNTKTQY